MTTPTDADVRGVREHVLEVALDLRREGLVVGTAGNVSARWNQEFVVITPSGVRYPAMRPEDLPVLRLDGTKVLGGLVPTSEKDMHLAMYRRDVIAGEVVGAVVHTHAPQSTAASTLLETIPHIHYAVASCGDPVRVAPYATYGSPELAQAASSAMENAKACLLQNHGTLAIGHDLDTAYERTTVLEWTCQIYLAAAAAGRPHLISDPDYRTVVAKLASYGQPPSGPDPESGTPHPESGAH